ncbi:hypothetical protein [Streptomyces sp. NPDC059787]
MSRGAHSGPGTEGAGLVTLASSTPDRTTAAATVLGVRRSEPTALALTTQ